jgi:hypothetical protein
MAENRLNSESQGREITVIVTDSVTDSAVACLGELARGGQQSQARAEQLAELVIQMGAAGEGTVLAGEMGPEVELAAQILRGDPRWSMLAVRLAELVLVNSDYGQQLSGGRDVSCRAPA